MQLGEGVQIPPWFYRAYFRYTPQLVAWCHARPGCKWNKELKCWLIPLEFGPALKEEAHKHGVTISLSVSDPSRPDRAQQSVG